MVWNTHDGEITDELRKVIKFTKFLNLSFRGKKCPVRAASYFYSPVCLYLLPMFSIYD